MKAFSYIFCAFVLMGCANIEKLNSVSMGQTKEQVLSVMGNPDTTRASDNIEYLSYTLYSSSEEKACIGLGVLTVGVLAIMCAIEPNYFVKLNSGKVVSYGKIGDFDSTKDTTIKIKGD